MKKSLINQSGFSVIEGIFVVLVLIVIAGVGIAVQHKNKKVVSGVKPATISKSISSKSYCDNAASICITYPESWKPLNGNEGGGVAEVIINPTSTANIDYLNIALGSKPTTAEIDTSNPGDSNSLTATNSVNTSQPVDLHAVIIKPLSNKNYDLLGGYISGSGDNIPNYFIVDASLITSHSVAVGNTTALSLPASFTNSKQPGQYTALGGGPITATPYTATQAQAWFKSADATSLATILESATFN